MRGAGGAAVMRDLAGALAVIAGAALIVAAIYLIASGL